MSANPGRCVVLSVLRGFTITVDREEVPLIWSAQRLLAFLALRERRLTRTYVAGVLWPETTAQRANANLRSALWRTQRSCGQVVDSSPQQLGLARTVAVDMRVAVGRAHRLLDAREPCDDILTAATRVDLSQDVLVDWYDDDWVLMEREQYHQLRLHALEAMCERLIVAGRYGEAVDAGMSAVHAEPLRESAYRALIKAHLAAGNRSEAIHQFQRCRSLVLAELGLEPSAELARLLPAPRSVEVARVEANVRVTRFGPAPMPGGRRRSNAAVTVE
jgi:DNA-binding SARP family transcriptional activator